MAEELYLGGGGGGVAGAFTAGASTGGNTAGTTGTVNNGVLFFGGANITLSESKAAGGATLSIIGGAGAAFSGGVSTGGNTAGTTGTVGNGILFFGGNSITLSQSSAAGGASVSVVGPSAWSQTGGISNLGNTAGTSGIASGSAIRVLFAGGNNVTLSQSLNGASATITISAPNLQTAISGIAGSGASTVTNGTVQFANANNVSFGLNGSTMTASITAQTVESQSIGMSNLGNTSGTSGIASGGQVRFLFAGGNNITLSQSLNGASGTITISGGAGGAFSGGVSTGGNTAGTTGTVNNGLLLYGGANVTLSQSSGAGGATVSIVGGAGGAFSAGVSTQGNTSGTTGTVNNGVVFVGGNNITLSQSSAAGGATVTISAPSGGGAGVSTGGNTAGTTGTVDQQIVFHGGTNITLSQSINGGSATLSILGAAGGGGNQSIGITNGAGNLGTTGFVTGAAIQYLIQRVGPVSLSQSINGSSGTLSILGANPPTETIGMSNLGNTSGTSGVVTGSAGIKYLFAGGNNITLSQSLDAGNSVATLTISAGAGGGSQSIGMSNLGNTAGTTGIVSDTAVRYLIVGSNNITLSQSLNGQSGTLSIIGGAGGAFSGGVSTGGNTSGGTGTVGSQLVFVGSNNITLSQSINGASATITISGGAGGGGAAIGMTNTGNTSGTNFTTNTGTVYFQGTNNITVSNSSAAGSLQTLWISGPTGGGAGMGSTTNTFGTSGTVGAELYFFARDQISLSQSVNGASASLTIQGEPVRSKFYWMPEGAITSSAMTHGSASFQAVMVPYDISFTRVDIPIQIAWTTSATPNTGALVISSGCVIYSVSNGSTLNPVIGSFGTTTHTFASNSAGNQSIAGGRFASFGMGTSLSAGWYIVGFQLSTANTSSVGTATTAIPVAISVLLGSNYTALAYNDIGSATAASTDIPWGRGVAASTITATNATMNINGITQTGVSKCRGNFHVLFRAIP